MIKLENNKIELQISNCTNGICKSNIGENKCKQHNIE